MSFMKQKRGTEIYTYKSGRAKGQMDMRTLGKQDKQNVTGSSWLSGGKYDIVTKLEN